MTDMTESPTDDEIAAETCSEQPLPTPVYAADYPTDMLPADAVIAGPIGGADD